jgi:hypothetical protein
MCPVVGKLYTLDRPTRFMKRSASRRKITPEIPQGISVIMRAAVGKLYTQCDAVDKTRRQPAQKSPQKSVSYSELLPILVSGIVYHSRRRGVAARR